MDFTKPRNLSANLLELIQSSDPKDVAVDFTLEPARSRKYEDQEEEQSVEKHLNVPVRKQVNVPVEKQPNVPVHLPPIKSKQLKPIKKGKKESKKGKKESKKEIKNEVDIDAEIGQVAEWAENGMKDDFQDDDFQQEGLYEVAETAEQKEIRKNIEVKLNNYDNKQQKPKGGLLAKAEELKRLNEERLNEERLNEERLNQEKLKLVQPSGQNTSSMDLLVHKKTELLAQADDPWQAINKQTLNKYSNKVKKEVTWDTVLRYYKQEFLYDRAAIQAGMVKVEKREASCLKQLLSCFSSKPEQEQYAEVQLRLMGIAKKQLTNTDEQFFLLQQIWAHFQNKPFLRYGNHWNDLGFQGRDPATDLRSTGILSLLQWYQFCVDQSSFSLKVAAWMAQAQFPFALTHIKATAIFLELLQHHFNVQDRKTSWEGLQNDYNSIAYGLISLIMKNHKIGESIGSVVDDQAKQLKAEYNYWRNAYKESKI